MMRPVLFDISNKSMTGQIKVDGLDSEATQSTRTDQVAEKT